MSNKRNNGAFKVPADVIEFAEISFKKYKKGYKDDPYTRKKDIKKNYYDYLMELLPEVILVMAKYPNMKEVRDITSAIYEKLTDEPFIAKMKKAIEKDGKHAFDYVEYLPIVINGFMRHAAEWEKKLQQEDGDDSIKFDTTDLVDLASMVLTKKLKKLKKAGLDTACAFDCLSVLPDQKLLERGGGYRIRQLMYVIYEHAKTKTINMDIVAKHIIGEEFYPTFLTSLLLEKKELYVQFDDKQKEQFNAVTEWVFNTMETMPKDTIMSIIKSYVETRKREKDQNRDSNRRYFLSSLPETDFPRIVKVMNKLISEDESVKEFL